MKIEIDNEQLFIPLLEYSNLNNHETIDAFVEEIVTDKLFELNNDLLSSLKEEWEQKSSKGDFEKDQFLEAFRFCVAMNERLKLADRRKSTIERLDKEVAAWDKVIRQQGKNKIDKESNQ